jgi:hypothetical protein
MIFEVSISELLAQQLRGIAFLVGFGHFGPEFRNKVSPIAALFQNDA